MLKKYIGNKQFYKMIMLVALPIMLQQGITSFVSLLDNIMVGRLGTEEMSGVAIGNQLLFVYHLCIFGSLSGASVFLSQFFGAKDSKGMQYSFRFKLISAIAIFLIGTFVIYLFSENLIQLFLTDTGESVGDITKVLKFGHEYVMIMLFGIFPFAISQVYSSTLRETKEAIVPMISGIIAILVNLIFNYILIFGHLGFEAMGVKGAAIATVISRYVEMGILIAYTHMKAKRFPFIKGIYQSFIIPFKLIKKMLKKGIPLLLNEIFWSIGMTIIVQCYSLRGLSVIAAYNISSTVTGIFIVAFQALGRATAIIVGQMLGAKKFDEAVDTRRKMAFFSVLFCFFIGMILIGISFVAPSFYKTEEVVKNLATSFMIVSGICLPIFAYNINCYFTFSAGGVSLVTFLFDSAFVWIVGIPLAFILSKYTALPIVMVYLIVQGSEIVKSFIGNILIKKNVWVRNIVVTNEEHLVSL